jgi:hypothetical protein
MRLGLKGIYKRKNTEKARKLLRIWCVWVHAMRGETGELLEAVFRAAWMVEGH